MIEHPTLWILLISIIFWSFYERWDARRKEYIDHPKMTLVYFLFASGVLIFIYPTSLQLFSFDLLGFVFTALVLSLTYGMYHLLPRLFTGPQHSFEKDHHYWKLLDTRYIAPKFIEIFFQQTFFGIIVLLAAANNIIFLPLLCVATMAFIVAHIPLFVLQGKKIGMFYFLWSILGAPLFAYVLIASGTLWYSIALHMMFYTSLSMVSWLKTPIKY